MKNLITIFFILCVNSVHSQVNSSSYDTKKIIIRNTTDYEVVNLINAVNEVLNLEGVTIFVKRMPETKLQKGYIITSDNKYGSVIQANKKVYFLMLRDNLETSFINKVIIHELSHIIQMENGDLIMNHNSNIVIWKGIEYNINKVKHNFQKWEIDAREKEKNIIDYLKAKSLL